MKKLLALAALLFASASFAQSVGIQREVLGSGTPGSSGFERALPVLENDIYHAPQYMAGYPTAATIWPRVVEVPCTKVGDTLKCQGYEWLPKYGRGEYLFFKTVIQEPVAPQIVKEVVPVIVERKVFIEVPAKPKHE